MKVRCPYCRGFGSHNGIPCDRCMNGMVDTESICECGRPAIHQAGAELVCASDKCAEKALKPIPFVAPSPVHGEHDQNFDQYPYSNHRFDSINWGG